MPEATHARLAQLIRFYQAAAVNTAFGYGCFVLLVYAGVDKFIAQAVATVLGVAFNYVVYSRHVFRGRHGSKASFALAYLGNYALNVVLLALFGGMTRSPYLAGLAATLGASLANFVVLRGLVFRTRATT